MKKTICIIAMCLLSNTITVFITYIIVSDTSGTSISDSITRVIAIAPPSEEKDILEDIFGFTRQPVDRDYVPTPECAVEIADAVGKALFENFDGKNYDVVVREYTNHNKWYVEYCPITLDEKAVERIAMGGTWLPGLGSYPIIGKALINKTTGEVTIYGNADKLR
jgi:hypothetical protein